jgi:uncharacterized protein (TIGR02246 family)
MSNTDRDPATAHDEFLAFFKAGDLDGLMSLYEDDATFVTADGTTRSGKAAVREELEGFLAIGGDIALQTRYAARCGDLALLSNEWRLTGTGADGQPLDMGGKTTEVVRLHADGHWRYVIDHPWGGQ